METDGSNMLHELIDLFSKARPSASRKSTQFVADPHKMAFHAHALRTMSLNLGAVRIAELCQKLEEMAHSGNEESAARVAQGIVPDISAALRRNWVPLRAYRRSKNHFI